MPNQVVICLSDFPSDVLKWMKANAKPKMALKLMKCHKYFQHFSEFPYFVVKRITSDGSDDILLYFTTLENQTQTKNIKNIIKKFWITGKIELSQMPKLTSMLIPKIAVCDIEHLRLGNQELTFDEFKILTSCDDDKVSNILELRLFETIIWRNTKQNCSSFDCDKNRDIVLLADILECVMNVKRFSYVHQDLEGFSLDSIKSLNDINNSVIEQIEFHLFPYAYFEVLSKFIKRRPQIEYTVYLDDNYRSPREIQIVENYVQNIIDIGLTDNPPPSIGFPEQPQRQRHALWQLKNQYIASK